MQINTTVPDFSLPDTQGKNHQLSDYRQQMVIVNFWSAECPWSERADRHLIALVHQYPGKLAILPVASNRNEGLEFINEAMRQRGLDLVLIDHDSALADAWGAQTTPHAFIVDQAGILRYQGAVDDVTFRKRDPEHQYVDEAVKALLGGKLPEIQEAPPYGCTIVRLI